jgi:hypothetical protein
MTRI